MINTWSECPPQSDKIWVQLRPDHSPTGDWNVVEIPFASGTISINGYEYDNYVRGVLAGEVSTATEPGGTTVQFDNETLKAMAVAIRTKVYHMCGNDTHDYFPDNDGIMRRGIRGQVIQNYHYNKALVEYSEAERQRYQNAVNSTDSEYLTHNSDSFDIQYRDISIDPTKGTEAPHLSVADPVGIAHAESISQTGMPQYNADHWSKGHSHGTSYPQWNYHQTLAHYYTGVHLRDIDDINDRLTPEYRWNLLDISWSEAGCPSIIPSDGSCTGVFYVQNTGPAAWVQDRAALMYHSWEQQGQNREAQQSRITITEPVTPGQAIHIPFTITPPEYVQSGEQYRLRFEMWYWDENDNNWASFSDAEAGRPWPTYDISLCIDACRVYLPLITKNYPAVYFFDTFNPINDGWDFYADNTQGDVNDYVYVYTAEGHDDSYSLHITDSLPDTFSKPRF